MEKSIREFSGRAFSQEEIELIQWTVKTYPNLNRTELAKTVCEFVDWNQINGKPKTIQSISMLKRLEEEGIVQLPPICMSKQRMTKTDKIEAKRVPTKKNAYTKLIQNPSHVLLSETTTPATQSDEVSSSMDFDIEIERQEGIFSCDCDPIEVVPAVTMAEGKRWRRYIQEYHMLGYRATYGAQIRYFIRSGSNDMGCLQFSASAWALAPRDKWIGWTLQDRKQRLHLVINNSRFLVLPWVQVKNMASKALSLAARRIESDWLSAYSYAPVLLETFVDTAHYKGTCYKAANWAYLGHTQGRGRQDRRHERQLSEKAIYVYPLHRRFREILNGNEPYKVVCPDE